jgi:hypothetical protein
MFVNYCVEDSCSACRFIHYLASQLIASDIQRANDKRYKTPVIEKITAEYIQRAGKKMCFVKWKHV